MQEVPHDQGDQGQASHGEDPGRAGEAGGRGPAAVAALRLLGALPLLAIFVGVSVAYFWILSRIGPDLRRAGMLPALHLAQWAPLGWILGLHLWKARADRFTALLELLTGPWMLLPTAFGLVYVHARYGPTDIGHLQSIPVAFQGDGDFGGSNIYAWMAACLLWFGVTGMICLDLQLANGRRGLWLAGHWIVLYGLIVLTLVGSAGDNKDDRNLLLFASFVFSLATWLAMKHRPGLSKAVLLLAILLASDGTSPKAGHVPTVTYYTGPAFPARGLRHAAMLRWHQACNALLGGPALTSPP